MRPAPVIVCLLALLIACWVVVKMSSSEVIVDNEATETVPQELGPHPTAEVNETVHDFGEMFFGDKGSHVFKIKNTGDEPLQLEIGQTTCSCTVGDLADGALLPGETTDITLEWKIKLAKRIFHHGAEVKTNDPLNPVINFQINGRVVAGVVTIPADVVELGVIYQGGTGTATVQVASDLEKDMQILGFEATHPWVKATFRPMSVDDLIDVDMQMGATPTELDVDEGNMAKTGGLKSGQTLELTVRPEGDRGAFSGVITLKTNVEKHETYELAYSGTFSGPVEFVALPGTAYLADRMLVSGGRFDAAEGKKSELLMFIRGFEEQVEFSELTVTPDWVNVTLTPDKVQSENVQRFRLKIEVPPGRPAVTRTGEEPVTISVKTNHPGIEVLEVNYAFSSL